MKELQKRTITLTADLRLREAAEGDETPSRILEGYAAKFGTKSELMGWYNPFREVLEPGCISPDMLKEQRVYFTMFHNRESILGRYDKGKGTLSLTADGTGLKIECELPNTPDGDKALELVRRGDLTEMSFAYSTDEADSENAVSYEKTDETHPESGAAVYVRHVKRIDNIYDVTIAADPAYSDTEIKAREAEVAEVAKRGQKPDDDKPDDVDVSLRRESRTLRKIASAALET